MHKTTVNLPDDISDELAAAKAAGVTLSELIRRGLAALMDDHLAPAEVNPDGWMTVQEAAVALDITESRVHGLLAEGWLFSRKDGYRRQIWAESVSAELARRDAKPPYPSCAYLPHME
jgi:hypothetical protein